MAARRLMLLLLGVIAISTLATAVLAPRSQEEEPPPAEEGTPAAEPGRPGSGRLIDTTVQAGRKRPARIELRPGDQLELMVRSASATQVEIPRFGLLEDADPGAPAHFSLLVEDPAAFEVRLAPSGRAIARIVVTAPSPPDRRGGRGGAR